MNYIDLLYVALGIMIGGTVAAIVVAAFATGKRGEDGG